MRKFVWLTGAIGLVGLAISAGTAQETSLPMPSSYRAAMGQTQNQATPTPSQLEAARQSRLQTPRRGGLSLLRGTRPAQPQPTSATTAQAAELQRYQRQRSAAQGQAAASPASAAQPDARPQIPAITGQQRESITGLKNYSQLLFANGNPASEPKPALNPAASPRPISAVLAGPQGASGNATTPRSFPAGSGTMFVPQPTATTGAILPASAAQSGQPVSEVIPANFAQTPGAIQPIEQLSGATAAPALAEFGSAPPADNDPILPRASGLTEPIATPQFGGAPGIRTSLPASEFREPSASTRATASASTNYSTLAPRVQVHWKKHGDINVGQPCEVELIVSNVGEAQAGQIAVDVWFPATVRLTKTVPEPVSVTEVVTWDFARLDAGERRSIMIMLIPSKRGEITANANVRFTTAATKTFSVDEPMLSLVIQGPEKVLMGEPASQIVTVSNPGSGVAQNVIVDVHLPEGLQHPKGGRLKMELGSLSAGESRSVRLTLTARAGGQQTVRVIANAGTGLERIAESKVLVLAPSLQLVMNGPSVRYVGRDARYTLTATNDGLAVTNNVRAMYLVPEGFEFVYAGRGGKYDPKTRTVSWFVGSVAPGDKVEMQLKLKPVQLGDFTHVARVLSEHGASAEAQAKTSIQGTASLVLEVADLDDPVEIGRDTAYEIRIRNDGSKEAQNVGLSIELPVGIEILNIQGPTQHIAESGLIVFKSIPSLPSGKTATFRIQIKGTEEGNQRIRARLTSDSIQEPLTVEELTRFYAD